MSDYDPDEIDAEFDELIRVSFGEASVPHRHLSNRPPEARRPPDGPTNQPSGPGHSTPDGPQSNKGTSGNNGTSGHAGPAGRPGDHADPPRPSAGRPDLAPPHGSDARQDSARGGYFEREHLPQPLPSPHMWSGRRMAGALMLATGLITAMLVVFGIQLVQPLPTLGGLLSVIGLAVLLSGVSRQSRDDSGPWDNGSRL